jgi:2,3,4,5-tetrahydropyridine-2,6-dicarboxylate N-succinyltransferase
LIAVGALDLAALENELERLLAAPPAAGDAHALDVLEDFLFALESGAVRAAVPDHGHWAVQPWVKRAILLGFRLGQIRRYEDGLFPFFDKDTYPPQSIDGLGRRIRIVPGGSAVRRGAYLGEGVVCMPPMYVNVGAYVGEGTMIDSHALVGSCAQVGRRVHLSAAAQVGGVLEPAGALPVIVEDEVMVGGNCGVYEGTLVRRRAVIGAGVVLTGSTPVYDLVREKVYRRQGEQPLEIPEGAVVLPGSRPLRGEFAGREGLHIATPVIVKYRDEKTDASTALEEALR